MDNNFLSPAEFEDFFGAMGTVYLTENYKPLDGCKKTAPEEIIVYAFFDIDYPDDTEYLLSAGENFTIVGISEDSESFKIEARGLYFAVDAEGITL